MRIATFNVHGCVGNDGRLAPERVAAVIREMDVRIVGLQEVDTGYKYGHDQLATLSRLTGMHGIAGPTLSSDRGHYGNAVLVADRPRRIRRWHLFPGGRRREARGALAVELEWAGRSTTFVVTHFGTGARERAAQVRELAARIEALETDVTVVVGDFNEWRPVGATLRGLDASMGPSRGVRSFPARRPLFKLDRIWVKPNICLAEIAAHRSPLARIASDHLPVVAALRPEA